MKGWIDRDVFVASSRDVEHWRLEYDHDCCKDTGLCRSAGGGYRFETHRKLRALISLIDALQSDLDRLCGPVCPHDGKYAVEHISRYQSHLVMRSFEAPLAKHPHEYEECVDCDAMSEDHLNNRSHCHYCREPESDCDGTPWIGGGRPPHPAWPEGEQWLRERR